MNESRRTRGWLQGATWIIGVDLSCDGWAGVSRKGVLFFEVEIESEELGGKGGVGTGDMLKKLTIANYSFFCSKQYTIS